MLSRPSEPRSGLCFKEAQVLPEGRKWAKASRKSGRESRVWGEEGEEFSEEVLLSRHEKSGCCLGFVQREERVSCPDSGTRLHSEKTGGRQGLGDASFRELTFVGPSSPLRHQRGPQPMEELPIPLSSRGGKVQADNRAPGRHRRNSEARGVSQVICIRVCLQMKS